MINAETVFAVEIQNASGESAMQAITAAAAAESA